MTYWDDEKSAASGVPVELHQFHARGTSDGYWRYADAPVNISYGGNTFAACYIKGEEIEQGSNALRNQTKVLCDWDNPFAAMFLTSIPEQAIDYTRYKAHGANTAVTFLGVVTAVRFRQAGREGKRHAEIFIDPAANDLRESGLVMRSGRQCQVALYSTPCGILRASYRVAGAAATVSGVTVTSGAFGGYPAGWFQGGDFLTAGGIVGQARRKIVYHLGATVKLSRLIYGLSAGTVFDAYPGCDHTADACKNKFNNILNFRGQPLIPDNDPWEDPVG